ncbi:MAG: hypothetical protein H5T73_06530 [Actinobacteria bacterium]|nr:hypothetical protein [Actinomycetota bacterium]
MSASCDLCGVPAIIPKTHRWENGCIVNRASGNANFSIYEADFHNGLFEDLERRMGPFIHRMVYIAGRIAAAGIAKNLFSDHPVAQRLMFRTPIYRRTQKSLILFARAIGMGKIELLGHRKGKMGAVRVTNPFHLAHCTAVILGGLDVIYGFPAAFTARAEGDSYVGELVVGKRDEVASDEAYLRLASQKLLPSNTADGWSLPSCGRCGVPREVGELFRFDLAEGVIEERATGSRHIFYGHQSLNAILREFERELGPEVREFFVRAEKENFAAKLSSRAVSDGLWDEENLRRYLALRGMGFLSRMEDGEGHTIFEIRNVFTPTVVAGRLTALWEHEKGKAAAASYHHEGNALRLEMTPS